MSWHRDISISVLTRCCVIHRKNTRLLKLPQSPCGESQLLFYWNWVSCFPQLFFLCQQGTSAFVLLIPVPASVELRKASEKFPAVFAALHAAVCPPPRLCSILWVSFVFLILLRGFSAVSHGEWTRPGLKTLSWRCYFCFFFGQCSLCVPLILVYSMYNNCCGARAVLLGSVQTLRSALSDHRRVNTFIKTLEDDLASGGANPAFRRSIHGAFKWPPADAQISFFISCHTHMSWHMVECQVLLSV